MGHVDVISSGIALDHFLGIGSVLRAAAEVSAHSVIVSIVAEATKLGKTFSLHHEVHSLRLLIMIDELWDDDINQLQEIVSGFILLNSEVVVLPDLSCETS